MAPADTAPTPRTAARRKVFLPGTMRAGGRSVRIHLLDVSTTGARLHCADEAEAGETIAIEAPTGLGLARICWRTKDRIGVVFATPLSQAAVDTLLSH